MTSQIQLAAIGVGVVAVVLVAAIALWYRRGTGDEESPDGPRADLPDGAEPVDGFEPPEDVEGEIHAVTLPRPDIHSSSFGFIGQLWKMRKHYRKEERLHDQGYVKWYLVSDTWPEPIYVKPQRHGDGMPRVYEDGDPYLFPKDGLLPDERQGLWTAIHKQGEADPINVRDPGDLAISTDKLDELFTMSVATDPPSFWDRLDISGQDAIMYAVGATIFLAVGYSLLGGA